MVKLVDNFEQHYVIMTMIEDIDMSTSAFSSDMLH